jgi:hypothetical protein
MRAPRGLAGLAGLLCCGVMAAACSNPSPHESTGTTTTNHTSTTITSTTSVSPSTGSGGTNTTTTGIGPCPEVSASLGQTQGAAGTIIGTIDVTSLGSRTCTMEGYPTLTRFNAAGITITANIVHGLTVNLSGPASEPPALVTLAAGQGAAFDFEYSDVPTGEATSCPSSTSLSVTTPGALTPSPHFAVTMAPCDDETIAVSPVYAVSG